jgi:hypothetical protein
MTKYVFDLCDNCKNSEIINEEGDIRCEEKDKTVKRTVRLRHCNEYDPIKTRFELIYYLDKRGTIK